MAKKYILVLNWFRIFEHYIAYLVSFLVQFTDPVKALYCALCRSCRDVYHPRYLFGSHFIQTNAIEFDHPGLK